MFFHDQGDLKDCAIVRRGILLRGGKVVGNFLVALFLVHSTEDYSFHLCLNSENVYISGAVRCLHE